MVVLGRRHNKKEYLNLVERFNFLGNYWEELSPMNEPRYHATAV